MKPRCFFVANFVPMCSIWDMGRDIRTALETAGVSVMEFLRSDFPNAQLHEIMLRYITAHKGPRFLFDINANENYRSGDVSFYDRHDLPRASFITDSPLRHMSKILGMTTGSALCLVDRDFARIVGDFGCSSREVLFFPHGGPPPLDSVRTDAERDIPFLMIGNIGAAPGRDALADRYGGYPGTDQMAVRRMIDRIWSETTGLYDVIVSESPDLSLDHRLEIGNGLEQLLIAERRADLVKSLAGRGLHLYGSVDATVARDLPSDVTVGPVISFEDGCDLMERTRVVVNSSPSFRNGGHERIFYAQSRGAYVLTEPSRFLEQEAADDLGLSFLPFDTGDIAGVLDHAANAGDARRDAATDHYRRTHTWAQRTAPLLDRMTTAFWS